MLFRKQHCSEAAVDCGIASRRHSDRYRKAKPEVHRGPAKVRPTYIFAGNIILVTFECIGKIQWFLADVITV